MKSTGMIKTNRSDNKSYRSLSCLCLTLLLLVAFAATFVAPLWAANEGPNIPISVVDGATTPDTATLLNDDQQNPAIIAVSDKNKWFVVWEDWRNWSSTGADIYGRFINNDGTFCGKEIAISKAVGNQTVPAVAYSGDDDNIIVAWQDTRGISGYLTYKFLDVSSLSADCSSGVILGGEGFVGYTSVGGDSLISRKLPKVAYDTVRNQFWLVWVEGRSSLQQIEEWPFNVAPTTYKYNFGDSSYVGYATIAAATGTQTLVDIVRNQDAFTRSVRLISHNTIAKKDVYIYENFKNINNVSVACDESSPEALIIWEGVRSKATWTFTYNDLNNNGQPDVTDSFVSVLDLGGWGDDDGQVHIFGLFDKYIRQAVVTSQLIDASSVGSYYPAVGFDNTHRKFLVAWEDRDPRNGAGDGIHSKIYGQLLYSGGGLYGNNIPISFQDTNGDGDQDANILSSNQTRPQISIDTTNQRFFVTWQDGRNSQVSLENLDIFGQFVDSEGSLRGNNYAVCVEPANQYNPVTAYNLSTHQFLSVWKDARNLNTTNSDIYGQRLTMGQPQLIILKEDNTLLVPPLLDFDSVQIGSQASSTLMVKMKNNGDSTVKIDYVTPLVSPYAYVSLPPELESKGDRSTIDLVPGATYNLYIKFSPKATGTFISSFTIYSDTTSLAVNLQGVAVEPPPVVNPDVNITVSPMSYSYGNVNLGESATQFFTFTNNGNEDVTIGETVVPEGFSVKGMSGTIKAGASFVTLVTFTPIQLRSYSGNLMVFYGAGQAPTQIYLSGVGQGNNDVNIIVSPMSHSYGNVNLGESATQFFTFTNNGNEDVTIGETVVPEGFSVKGMSGTIEVGASFVTLVTFSPIQPRSYSGTLMVFYEAGQTPTQINLSGVGHGNVNASVIPPENTDFGNVAVGETRSANLVFTNTGNVDIVITAIDLPDGSGFEVSGLPATIPVYGTLTALATFSPTMPQLYSSTLRVLYEHGVAASEITLSGLGVYNVKNVIEVPDEVEFDSCNTGESKSANLRFVNKGSVDVKITAVDLPDGVFAVSGIPGTIPAEGVLDALVTFTPLLEQDYDITMRVLYDQGVVTSDIKLQGSGVDISAPAVSVAPLSFLFGKTAIGASKTETLIVTNTGNVDLEIVGVDLPGALFAVEGIGNGTLAAGMSTVAIVTFTPVAAGDFSGDLRLLFDHDLEPQEIMMQGTGVDLEITPESLTFPNSDVDCNTVLSVTITNRSENDLQVKSAVTKTDSYSVSGIKSGDIIRGSGGALVCQVTFKPIAPGLLEDALYLSIGPVVEDEATAGSDEDHQYIVSLEGVANADFVIFDYDTYTGDIDYKASISASTGEKGQLFVLFSHDPLSQGDIYALASDGTLKLFPYNATFGWQNLWYKPAAAPGMKLDLSQVDFRGLGCSQCQGEIVDNGDDDFHFGNIIITPPNDEVFNNATDFKYMSGTLYMGTYVKDASGSGAFDFNQGLLEMQSLHINSLAGTWRVTSRYNNQNRVHPTQLVVTENGDGTISAIWPGYNVSMVYGTDESGYVMTFNIGIYQYTFNISDLTDNTFSGFYTCVANGETLDSQPFCGVRAGSGVECSLSDPDSPVSGGTKIASFSSNANMTTRVFKVTGPWEIQWDFKGSGYFDVYLHNADGSYMYSWESHVVSLTGPGVGALYKPDAGEYYLEVVPIPVSDESNWKINIVQLK